MGRTVGPGESGTIKRKDDRQRLDGTVVYNLIEAPLQEGAVNRDDRDDPLCRHAGGEGDRMFFGDADIEGGEAEEGEA